ncbi:MAG: signal peptidase II [Burkholderiaceae bacterium]
MARRSVLRAPATGPLWLRLAPWLLLSAIVIGLDRISKILIEQHLGYGERDPILPCFDLTLLYNKGAAFSFLSSQSGWQRWMFTAIGVAAALFIVRLLARHGSQRLFAAALALILGGALGNVIDRVLHGRVVDFILVYWQNWYFPAFNVADSAITVGAVLLIFDELWRVRRAR